MAADDDAPPTRETARRLDEITDRLGKLQEQLDGRRPLYERESGDDAPAEDAPAGDEPGPLSPPA